MLLTPVYTVPDNFIHVFDLRTLPPGVGRHRPADQKQISEGRLTAGLSSRPSATWPVSSRRAVCRCARLTDRSKSWGSFAFAAAPKAARSSRSSGTSRSGARSRSFSGSATPRTTRSPRPGCCSNPRSRRLAALRAQPEDIAKLEQVLIQEEEEVRRPRPIPAPPRDNSTARSPTARGTCRSWCCMNALADLTAESVPPSTPGSGRGTGARTPATTGRCFEAIFVRDGDAAQR